MRSLRDEQCGGSNELALLVNIDGLSRRRYAVARTIANLNENEARVVQHDEIDFAEAAAEISPNQKQALALQGFKGDLLGVKAYSSRVSSYHDSSSAASGNSSSGSSLMS